MHHVFGKDAKSVMIQLDNQKWPNRATSCLVSSATSVVPALFVSESNSGFYHLEGK
jgi:hypothetical protein